MKSLLPLLIQLIISPIVSAAIDAYQFPNEELSVRYHKLIAEIRCPQCLNTNIAGSDAMIAKDLRSETHRLLLDGKTDEEILDFMHKRYGDFILYNPRVTPGTAVLWFGPLLFVVIALVILVSIVRRRRVLSKPEVDVEQLNALLGKHEGGQR